MIIRCPHCHARLNLPEHAEGMQVRCAICRQVFCADREALEESVQAGSPESASGSVTPKPREEETRPRAKPRRFEDDDDYDDYDDRRRRDRDDGDRHDSRDFSDDCRELVENAISQARPAGYAMLAAFVLTAVNIIANVVIFIFTDAVGLGPLSGFCHLVIYVPMVIFIGIAARLLFTLGSRGLIVTAIVMNFIVLLILGGAAFIAILMLATGALPAPDPVLVTALAIQSASSLANLAAAVMAIRALTSREVADGYAAQDQDQWRRRRY